MPSRPWFPFYVADFLADPRVQRMDAPGVGAYVLLLANLWHMDEIEEDPRTLRTMLRLTPAQYRRAWPLIRDCLEQVPGGTALHSPRMTLEKARADEVSERQSANAKSRWDRVNGTQRKKRGAPADATAHATADATASERHPGGTARDGPTASQPDAFHSSQLTEQARSSPQPVGRSGSGKPLEAGSSGELQVVSACRALVAARESAGDLDARVGPPSTWTDPMRGLLSRYGGERVLELIAWLWSAYEPDRPDFDWRERVFTPAHLLASWDGLAVAKLRASKAPKAEEETPACCPSCSSDASPVVDLDEDRRTCPCGITIARLRTVRCADCQGRHEATVTGSDACADCWPTRLELQQSAAVWGVDAVARAGELLTPVTPSGASDR
ncbi:MAG: hypothetical protein DRQ97_12275 [Gammaproteobacteria bacterium]|nr:MAG: hypothetical protein DRQ97_12275 [Gammaproteobacteria bacterium]